MKKTFFPLAVAATVLFAVVGCRKNETVIEIPVSIQQGYGPLKFLTGGMPPDNENHPWKETYLKVTGIPEDWTDAKKGDIGLDEWQLAYQSVLQGILSRKELRHMQRMYDRIPDTLNLSKQPLKCKIAFAYGKDADGEIKMVVDANNNLDFSDDVRFSPVRPDINKGIFNDSLALSNLIQVSYERFSGNRIVSDTVGLFIHYNYSSYNMFKCNLAQYLSAEFEGHEFAISSSNFLDLSYFITNLVMIDDSLKNGGKAPKDDMISENEYLTVDGKIYKYRGVNMNRGVMMLEKVYLPKDSIYSTQKSFNAIPFEGSEFRSDTVITLDGYRGKYLLVDFWSVWCGPCIWELPHMKTLYDNLDKSKMEILGIVCDSQPDELKKITDKYGVTWPQIMSDEVNRIGKKYSITGYPSNFIIDPDGVIIAKDLHWKDLEDKINELTAE